MKSLWELLWDYDPNALLVVDSEMRIQVTNPAFCRMFRREYDRLIGQDVRTIFSDVSDFERAWSEDSPVSGSEQHFPELDLYVRKVIFPIPNENLVACIFVDMTQEWKQKEELSALRLEAIAQVNQVVDKQMSVAQQIAGLLGETTAETKVSLMRLLRMLEEESPR